MKKSKKERIIHNEGITLTSLVITIVVLIILALISINAIWGNNGLIKQAEYAKDLSSNTTESQFEGMDEIYDEYANMMAEDESLGGEDETDNPREIEGVTIPEGFYYVGGSKIEGIVISDNEADLGKGTSHEVAQTLVGNQFVWIPVEDDSLFKRYEGYWKGELASVLSSCSEPYASGYSTEQSEYYAMVTSVLEHKGFYVGRYEAGTTATRSSSSGIEDEVVVKQGVNVYNYIGWSNSNNMTNETGGAVELAKNFDTANGYTSVTSTLIYGVEWDAVMNFIDPAYATGSCEEDSFVRDSSGKGNYTGILAKTGSNADYVVKNIYDLGGNVTEWTMEAYTTNRRSYRGGDFQRFRFWWSSFLS